MCSDGNDCCSNGLLHVSWRRPGEASQVFRCICCRVGEVLLVLARAFPNCELHGYDISAKSLGLAQER